ncbi:chromosomal replication initiator DnaA [Epibacterium ulvae]|uniref:HdaA/DnaA family protein n=1 Tax=Epibacterium ulvae TaxID=1156985 RepID=UPI001BFCCD98|nr:DnaA/Hda family protein [Epibacterium ulvae]MBT8155538.1 chromosomal replication initiator DnaA [Epibacterium ulvae]
MAQQLSFDLPTKPALEREDFFVAPSNAMAVALLDPAFHWPSGKMVLTGPKGAGKTHLAHVWARQSGAWVIPAHALPHEDIATLSEGPMVVEDVPDIALDPAAQEALFHLHNLVLAAGHALMMTGRPAPNHWSLTLPDLQSRVQAATHAELQAPDDALLAVVLAKLFNDRQIAPKPDVIPYLVAHMDRTFAEAAQIVARLDQLSLSEKRSLSRPLAIRALSDLASPGQDELPLE